MDEKRSFQKFLQKKDSYGLALNFDFPLSD